MAYVSIYRKYRPYDFDGIVGQEHIVKTLRNQIKTDTIGHAYLFTGTRGTGKTSTAKIFARAVNCVNNQNGQACGNCEVCKELAKPNNLDIIEIDAASNNGVDEIRELRESVKYPPSVGRYKVYIIDEVHMLSIGAFNALLKTLEEPPSHVIFILATTEVHKLPQTILSRCLQFDFRLVPTASIANRIKYIFDDMNIKYTEDACLAISEAGDGSVRDALSIADMCVSFGEGNVDYNVVLEVLGQSNPNIILDIVECTLNGDLNTSLTLIGNLANYGKSMGVLARDITKMFRNLFIVQNVITPEKVLSLPKEIINRLKEMRSFDTARVLQCVDIMSSVEANMRYSSMPRTLVESSIAKCSDARANIDLTGVITRLKAVEDKIANGLVVNGSTCEKVDKVKRVFNKSSCCGYLIKATRDLKKYALYSELTELNKDNFSMDNGIVYIRPARKNMADILLMPEYLELITDLLVNEFEGVTEVKVIQSDKIVNIDEDITLVKSMFDNDIVKIK